MKNLFSKKPDVRETVKSSQRTIGRNVRDIERELLTLKREEQQLVKQVGAWCVCLWWRGVAFL